MNKLSENALLTIDEICRKHAGRPGPVKLMLHDVQRELGYIPFEAMVKIAEASGVSASEVYGVVTFYTQFTTQPKGRHVINVCLGTACYVKGSQAIIDRVMERYGCAVNETSADGNVSLDATRCLGACGLAPVVVIDGKVYGSVTKQSIDTILDELGL